MPIANQKNGTIPSEGFQSRLLGIGVALAVACVMLGCRREPEEPSGSIETGTYQERGGAPPGVGARDSADMIVDEILHFDIQPNFHEDGGLVSLDINIQNTSNTSDVVLRVNRRLDASFMIMVRDSEGVLLSLAPPKFSTEDAQQLDEIHVSRAGTRAWTIAIKDRVHSLPQSPLQATIVVRCSVLYAVLGKDGGREADFRPLVTEAYTASVALTETALASG